MDVGIGLHRIKRMKAGSRDTTSWLTIGTDSGCEATIFIPYAVAKKIEEVWTKYLEEKKL